ncbi:Glycoside hydrolase family 35 [Penicillium cf. griseofulvum]|uniref:Beta-galactosidase n=1 Tax=Penicillium cf. griseofulvum TaxID=2972120 RepID=A0A9W9IX21_9EURO|nr:Glycoside hydrolase family 35 [Penicillium cf. griseofulvum]KAJ5430723.1 Glycoside hydrolase family 35 [Penicillium cf. griseofulvum]KAJ5435508.1 Glycoside hydrolase family 35 [Penicillium cf. griseofulvum]
MKLLSSWAIAYLAAQAAGAAISHSWNGFTITEHPDPVKRDLLQKHVTWDDKSLFVNGERIMIFSGEIHPYRLPVPSLWIDVLQKVKSLGFNCVSFYIDWALLEGKPGRYTAEGAFALEPFFEAAKEAGIYLLARPGPYINAEVSGGGFPGWLQRVNGTLRSGDEDFLKATDNYMANVAATMAKGQITNGGPIILFQPENEYSGACCGYEDFPDGAYMQYVQDQARNAGIVVPIISNDAGTGGHNAPGTGEGEVDIYGHDNYPLGFDCANPSTWPAGKLPTDFYKIHMETSPSTPYSLIEFQGGAFDPWGGVGFAKCAALLNHEFERVFYKNNLSFRVAILNLYMIFGGTNWGNLGHPGGYTSYDYGSPITESRNITREKYSELKLIGNFARVSPAYLLSTPEELTTSKYTTSSDLAVTPLLGGKSTASSFFVVRHSDYSTQASVDYKLKVPTSAGEVTIPQLGGSLTLSGRDSKVHVVDYDVAGTNILYSSAEVFTWTKSGKSKILVLYGGPGEHHELAVSSNSKASVIEGSSSSITTKQVGKAVVIGWDVSTTRRIVQVGDLKIVLLDRNSAYNYWAPQLPAKGESPGYSAQKTAASSLIVKAGYLVRTAFVKGNDLHLTADFNATTPIEVIGAPSSAKNLVINGKKANVKVDKNGIWSSSVAYTAPEVKLPTLKSLKWKSIDTLPELQSSYDDSKWVSADKPTKNSGHALKTPTSLFSSDYGFHTGTLLYRGHFVATGNEKTFSVQTQGGSAFGSSVWLNENHIGSWSGIGPDADHNGTYKLPTLKKGKSYVFTVVVDNMGLNENWVIGEDQMKLPRGILNYDLSDHPPSDITWKLTGNLGGEDYLDQVRGPLNEGGLYAERQGFHQPKPPTQNWESGSPFDGLSKPGIKFYTTSFDLDMEKGWDVPMYFNFGNSTSSPAYRAQLYVNGYQYAKYVSNIGPQTSFPVPEGILNYRGTNYLALSLWALDSKGAKLESFDVIHTTPVLTALGEVKPAGQPEYKKRKGAY